MRRREDVGGERVREVGKCRGKIGGWMNECCEGRTLFEAIAKTIVARESGKVVVKGQVISQCKACLRWGRVDK